MSAWPEWVKVVVLLVTGPFWFWFGWRMRAKNVAEAERCAAANALRLHAGWVSRQEAINLNAHADVIENGADW